MKNIVEILVIFTVLSYMSLNVEAIMCYNCTSCSDPFSSSAATQVYCNDTAGAACQVFIFKKIFIDNVIILILIIFLQKYAYSFSFFGITTNSATRSCQASCTSGSFSLYSLWTGTGYCCSTNLCNDSTNLRLSKTIGLVTIVLFFILKSIKFN